MIDATRFARPATPRPYPDGAVRAFRFGGADRADMAAELHRFADAVASGAVLVQTVQTGQRTATDDYASQALYIEFAEAHEVQAETRHPERIITLG